MQVTPANSGNTAVSVHGDDGRFYGVVEFDIRCERWRVRGAVVGPLAIRHPDCASASAALAAWQEANPPITTKRGNEQ